VSWQLASFTLLALVLLAGGLWFERSKPSTRVIAAVAALAALGVAGRLVLAPIPNVVATTDVALLAGYTLGGPAGFAVGALSALISNFWLGQGPWTPWQMAGWGAVGIGGAALAMVSARRLGRWGLAAAGAIAGFAFGALLDLSVMVNFGGEQSLDRYLALSVRGIPFNIAHAAGNAALMLAAGPAIVRMLDRYRDRFDVRWRELPAAAPLATVAVIAGLGALGAGMAASLATPPQASAAAAGTASAASASDWLVDARNGNGGYGTAPGEESSPGMTGWAMLGLEAAGVNPLDVGPRGRTPVDYLRRNAGDLDSTADLERTILALRGAGISPDGFGGHDLLAELIARRDRDGSYDGQTNLTSFAILAQASAGVRGSALGKSAAWLRKAQNKDGGWGSVSSAPSEPDSTGAVLQALAVAPGGDEQIARGARWLAKAQRGDGGWSLTAGATTNSQSTAWAVQGLLAAGGSSGAAGAGIDYLAGRQAGDGHYTYSRSSDQTPVWVTAQALAATGQEPFPIATVPRDPHPSGGGSGSGSAGGGSGPGPATRGGGATGGAGPGAFGRGKGGADKGGGKTAGKGKREPKAKGSGGAGATGYAPVEALDLAASDEAPTDDASVDDSTPSTTLLVGGLIALAAALTGGWFLYRRRFS
jgi:energy-coupling factor transport system substrate-specific component